MTSWCYHFDFLFKFFVCLFLLKCDLLKWTNYDYSEIIVFAELLNILNIIPLSLDDFLYFYYFKNINLFILIGG